MIVIFLLEFLYLCINHHTEIIKINIPINTNDHCTPNIKDESPKTNTHVISPAFQINSATHEIVHSSFGLVQSDTYADIIGRIKAKPKDIPKVIVSIFRNDSLYPNIKYNKDINNKIKNNIFLLLFFAEKLFTNKLII
jgi:hypothetical protein